MAIDEFVDRLRVIDGLDEITYVRGDGLMIEKDFRIKVSILSNEVARDDIETIIEASKRTESVEINSSQVNPQRDKENDKKQF